MLPHVPVVAAVLVATLSLVAQEAKPPDAKPAPAPHAAITPAPRSDAGIQPRVEETLRRARETPKAPVVFVGDSITQGWETTGKAAWR